jgi:hypothetical protein
MPGPNAQGTGPYLPARPQQTVRLRGCKFFRRRVHRGEAPGAQAIVSTIAHERRPGHTEKALPVLGRESVRR